MKRNSRRIIVIMLVLGMVVAVSWALFRNSSHSVELDDKSRLTLVEARLSQTNPFVIGTPAQKLLGNVIPSNGVSVLGFKLVRPVRRNLGTSPGEQLEFLFRLSNATNSASLFLDQKFPQPEFRLVIRAQSGHEYEGYLTGFDFLKVGPDRYAFGFLSAFPRDEDWFNVQVVANREGSRRVVAQYRVNNPAPRPSVAWKAEKTPITRKFDQLEVTLGEVTTGPHPQMIPKDPVETGSIPLLVLEKGAPATNWSLHDMKARDALGNSWRVPSYPIVSNNWCYHAIWGGLDPQRVWKLEAHLARGDSYSARADQFSADELCTMRLNLPVRGVILTNFAGVPVEFSSWNSGVTAQIPTNRSDLRLSFVAFHDQSGKKFEHSTGNWEQWRFSRNLDLPPAGGAVDVTFAIHRDYYFECFVQPKAFAKGGSARIQR